MMKKVIVTGADGYCGWPLVLRILEKQPEWYVYGLDNMGRRQWVSESGARSVIPISEPEDRTKTCNKFFDQRYEYMHVDLTDSAMVQHVFERIKPDIVLHLASQPSAPFSSIDSHHCNFTQRNNNSMLINIMFALNNLGLDDTHLIVTTTTGIYGAPNFPIPEGDIVLAEDLILPYPAMGGSWYHMSRAFDAANMWLAAKQFKFKITELRTSIVCGSSTYETKLHPHLRTRFDIDFYFGVVVNRFVAMAITGKDLTVYGKGLQKKPMISLEDMVRSTYNACLYRDKKSTPKYQIFNQVQEPVSIVDMANHVSRAVNDEAKVKSQVIHIPNPRVEDEEHQMHMDNDKFLEQLVNSSFNQTIEEAIFSIVDDIKPFINRIKCETFMR